MRARWLCDAGLGDTVRLLIAPGKEEIYGRFYDDMKYVRRGFVMIV